MPAKKKTPARPAAKSTPEIDMIRSLAGILNDTGLTEIELERQGTKFRVAKKMTAVAHVSAPATAAVHHAAHVAPLTAPAAKAADADHPGTVKSPMVGTVYRAPTPGTPNFVDVGTEVKEGQTLLIIEAMKTMNQINAPRAGKVTHVFVDNGHPVEYGEALVVIE